MRNQLLRTVPDKQVWTFNALDADQDYEFRARRDEFEAAMVKKHGHAIIINYRTPGRDVFDAKVVVYVECRPKRREVTHARRPQATPA